MVDGGYLKELQHPNPLKLFGLAGRALASESLTVAATLGQMNLKTEKGLAVSWETLVNAFGVRPLDSFFGWHCCLDEFLIPFA